MEHHNITIGFEGGSSETRIRDEIPKTCYEVVFADIGVNMRPFPTPRWRDHPDPDKQKKWATNGYSRANFEQTPVVITDPNITKRCLCISQLPADLKYFLDLYEGTPKWTIGSTYMRYSYIYMRKVCRPCQTPKCPCVGAKNIQLRVTDKTLVHTLSNGRKIKIKNPGHYKDVVEQVIEAELAIKISCFPPTN